MGRFGQAKQTEGSHFFKRRQSKAEILSVEYFKFIRRESNPLFI